MQKYSRISKYKTKKVLTFFINDETARYTAEQLKINRKTINRIYNVLREIIKVNNEETCKSLNQLELNRNNCVGYFNVDLMDSQIYKVYLHDGKLYLHKIYKKPGCCNVIRIKYLEYLLTYIQDRLIKFYGLNAKGIEYQIFESAFRQNYTKEEMFQILWKEYSRQYFSKTKK